MTSLRRDTRGAGFAEYLILVGAVALLGIGAYRTFGTSVVHKAETQADALGTLSVAPAADERSAGTSAAPEPGNVATPVASDAEGERSVWWTVGVFFGALLIAGGLVIATVARPRHAPSDGESEQSG